MPSVSLMTSPAVIFPQDRNDFFRRSYFAFSGCYLAQRWIYYVSGRCYFQSDQRSRAEGAVWASKNKFGSSTSLSPLHFTTNFLICHIEVMFSDRWNEGNDREIEIPDVHPIAFHAFLNVSQSQDDFCVARMFWKKVLIYSSLFTLMHSKHGPFPRLWTWFMLHTNTKFCCSFRSARAYWRVRWNWKILWLCLKPVRGAKGPSWWRKLVILWRSKSNNFFLYSFQFFSSHAYSRPGVVLCRSLNVLATFVGWGDMDKSAPIFLLERDDLKLKEVDIFNLVVK